MKWLSPSNSPGQLEIISSASAELFFQDDGLLNILISLGILAAIAPLGAGLKAALKWILGVGSFV